MFLSVFGTLFAWEIKNFGKQNYFFTVGLIYCHLNILQYMDFLIISMFCENQKQAFA